MADTFGRPSSEGRRLQVGFHPDSVVNSIGAKETPNKNKYVEIVFFQKEGSATQKIWYPKLDEVKPKEGQSPEDARRKAIDNFTGSLYVLLDALDCGEVQADSAEQFADKAITAITQATAKGKKCGIVLQYDIKGEWPEFPRYRWAFHSDMPINSIDTSKLRMTKDAQSTPTRNTKISEGDLF